MVYLKKLLYGCCLDRRRKSYARAKQSALRELSTGKKPKVEPSRLKKWWHRTCPVCLGGEENLEKRSKWREFEIKVSSYGTFENYIVKSFFGFIAGVCITYGLYFLFVVPLYFSYTGATVWCMVIGFISTLGLAFSEYFRSIALLSLPSLFSTKGQYALTGYAVILSVTGPGKNVLFNVKVLTDSIACDQEALGKTLQAVYDLVKRPYVSIMKSINALMRNLETLFRQIKALLLAIRRIVLNLMDVITLNFDWLNSVVVQCSSRIGSPYEKCLAAFEATTDDCRARLNHHFKFICSADYLARTLCSSYKYIDNFCDLIVYSSNVLVEKPKLKLNSFIEQVTNIFYVKVEVQHASKIEAKQVEQATDVIRNIATDIKELTNSVLIWFDGITIVFSVFYFYCFYSVITFRNKYLTHKRYKNHYLTRDLILIELERRKLGKMTIFPLNKIEELKYLPIKSFKLGVHDQVHLSEILLKSLTFFFKVSIHMAADYGLWWLINDFRKASLDLRKTENLPNVRVKNDDPGLASNIFLQSINAFQPKFINATSEMIICLPDPKPPDMQRYATIAFIGGVIVLSFILEPFCARMRICIMNFYYPAVSRRRAIWLYNQILRNRATYLKLVRRRLKRKYGKVYQSHGRFPRYLPLKVFQKCPNRFKRIQNLFRDNKIGKICLVCRCRGTPNEPLNYCTRLNCPGIYCPQCFDDLQNVCTLCKTSAEYGDLSDESEERGSGTLSHSSGSSESNFDYNFEEEELDYSYQNRPRDIGNEVPIEVEHYDIEKKEIEKVNDKIFNLSPEEKLEDEMAKAGAALTLAQRRHLGLLEFIFPKTYKRTPYLFDADTQLTPNLTKILKSKSFFHHDPNSSNDNPNVGNTKGLIDRFLRVLRSDSPKRSSLSKHSVRSESTSVPVNYSVQESRGIEINQSFCVTTALESNSRAQTLQESESHDANKLSKVAYLKRKLFSQMNSTLKQNSAIRKDTDKSSLIASWVNTGRYD